MTGVVGGQPVRVRPVAGYRLSGSGGWQVALQPGVHGLYIGKMKQLETRPTLLSVV
jgi:hypothetical protein